jgi:hypothetical protein
MLQQLVTIIVPKRVQMEVTTHIEDVGLRIEGNVRVKCLKVGREMACHSDVVDRDYQHGSLAMRQCVGCTVKAVDGRGFGTEPAKEFDIG